jgi:hypothetical protein
VIARETISVPVEPYVATLVTTYHGLNHMRAKALARRRIDARTSCLRPAEHELSVFSVAYSTRTCPVGHR